MNLRGVIPVLTTPFHADESIDESSLRQAGRFLHWQWRGRICALRHLAVNTISSPIPSGRRVAEIVVQHVDRPRSHPGERGGSLHPSYGGILSLRGVPGSGWE